MVSSGIQLIIYVEYAPLGPTAHHQMLHPALGAQMDRQRRRKEATLSLIAKKVCCYISLKFDIYYPYTKLREGHVFTGVCLFGGGGVLPPTVPWEGRPPPLTIGETIGGRPPSGMDHYCFMY